MERQFIMILLNLVDAYGYSLFAVIGGVMLLMVPINLMYKKVNARINRVSDDKLRKAIAFYTVYALSMLGIMILGLFKDMPINIDATLFLNASYLTMSIVVFYEIIKRTIAIFFEKCIYNSFKKLVLFLKKKLKKQR